MPFGADTSTLSSTALELIEQVDTTLAKLDKLDRREQLAVLRQLLGDLCMRMTALDFDNEAARQALTQISTICQLGIVALDVSDPPAANKPQRPPEECNGQG